MQEDYVDSFERHNTHFSASYFKILRPPVIFEHRLTSPTDIPKFPTGFRMRELSAGVSMYATANYLLPFGVAIRLPGVARTLPGYTTSHLKGVFTEKNRSNF